MELLHETFAALDQTRKRTVQVWLCQGALVVLEHYFASNEPIDYHDSVVGMHHVLDTTLPADALASVVAGNHSADVSTRYNEPIAALQDDDLWLPDHIEFAYYALYNLHCKYVEGRPIDDWLIVNQALSAESDPTRWRPLLIAAMSLV